MLPLKIFVFLFYDWIYNWKHCSAVFIDISVVEFREKQGFIKISIKHTHFLLDTAFPDVVLFFNPLWVEA